MSRWMWDTACSGLLWPALLALHGFLLGSTPLVTHGSCWGSLAAF